MTKLDLRLNNIAIGDLEKDIELIKDEPIQNWAYSYLHGHIPHYNGILRQFEKAHKIKKIDKILEIGGVPGQLTSFLASRGFKVKMVDVNPSRIDGILKKYSIEAFQCNVEKENLPFDDETFDLVLFNEVFEHLHINPLKVIGEIHRVLVKDGILLMSVPNINPLMRWEFLFGRDYNDNLKKEFSKVSNIGHMGHFRLYSQGEVDGLLKDFQFEILECSFDGKLYQRKSKWLKLFHIIFRNKMRNQYHVIAKRN